MIQNNGTSFLSSYRVTAGFIAVTEQCDSSHQGASANLVQNEDAVWYETCFP